MGTISRRCKLDRRNIPRTLDDLGGEGELVTFNRGRQRSNLYIVTVRLTLEELILGIEGAVQMGAVRTRGFEGLVLPSQVLAWVTSGGRHLVTSHDPYLPLVGDIRGSLSDIRVTTSDIRGSPDPSLSLVTHKGEIWRKALGELQLQMTRATFDTWLRGSRVIEENGDGLTVELQHPYAVEWIDKRLRPVIERTLARHEEGLTVVFVAKEGTG